MKKLLLILTVIFISNSISAQTAMPSSEGNAKVYFLRSDGFPPVLATYNVFLDEALVCKVGNKRFSIHNVTPGSHVITSQIIGSKPGKKADRDKKEMEAGKTYYIQLHYKHGIFSNKLKTKEISEEAAKKIMAISKENKNCK